MVEIVTTKGLEFGFSEKYWTICNAFTYFFSPIAFLNSKLLNSFEIPIYISISSEIIFLSSFLIVISFIISLSILLKLFPKCSFIRIIDFLSIL